MDIYILPVRIPSRHTVLGCSADKRWIDERAVPPAGRIGETEDLIGSIFVQEGKVSCRDPGFDGTELTSTDRPFHL